MRWAVRPSVLPRSPSYGAAADGLCVGAMDGALHEPDPINASMGMPRLAIVFVVTPWLARLWMKATGHTSTGSHAAHGPAAKLAPLFERVFRLRWTRRRPQSQTARLAWRVSSRFRCCCRCWGWCNPRCYPFDNKSEFQVVVDMPAGTPSSRLPP